MDIGKVFERGWKLFVKDVAPYVIGALILAALSVVTIGILYGPLSAGLYVMAVRRVRQNRTAEIGDVFWGLGHFWRYFGAALLLLILIGIGFVFLIVPGLLLATIWIYVFPVMVDRDMGVFDAMAERPQAGARERLRPALRDDAPAYRAVHRRLHRRGAGPSADLAAQLHHHHGHVLRRRPRRGHPARRRRRGRPFGCRCLAGGAGAGSCGPTGAARDHTARSRGGAARRAYDRWANGAGRGDGVAAESAGPAGAHRAAQPVAAGAAGAAARVAADIPAAACPPSALRTGSPCAVRSPQSGVPAAVR